MMKTEATTREYLHRVLALAASGSYEELIRVRQQFLADLDWRSAEPITDETDRVEQNQAIVEIRARFWLTAQSNLLIDLGQLSKSQFPEVSAAAGRLLRVAKHFDQYQTLGYEERIPIEFRQAILSVSVAKSRDANVLREKQFSRIRPSENITFLDGHFQIQRAIDVIRKEFPVVHEGEQAWFGELYFYRPSWEQVDPDSDQRLGYWVLFLIAIFIVLLAVAYANIMPLER